MTRAGQLASLAPSLVAALALALAGCDTHHAEKVHRYEVRGVVQDVDPAHGQALIDHEEIPGFMPAMTMSYDVDDPAVLARLAVGQRISFTLDVRDASVRIVDAKVLAERVAPGRAGAIAAVAEAEDLAPDFALTDQDGRAVSLASLRGKTLLLDFVYTHCPGPCPILTGRHAQVQRALSPALRAGVHFVSITVDPERDTPEALKAYALARGADLADWSFLTGPPDAVRDVLKRYGVFAQPSALPGQVDHIVVTLLIDREGRVVRRLFGTEDGAAAVQAALEEAAA